MAGRRARARSAQPPELDEPRTISAATAAKELAFRFRISGSYEQAARPLGIDEPPVTLASSRETNDVWNDTRAFAGIKVHAVAHEAGVPGGSVIIYATKGSARELGQFPKKIGGVPIRISRIAPVSVDPESSLASGNKPIIHERAGRVACGSSCAPGRVDYAGTLGCLVQNDGMLCALSANHVFAECNHTPIDMPILSPANADASPNWRPPGPIARHHKISPLRSGDPIFVDPCSEDVAIAKIDDPDLVSSWQGDDKDGYDTPAEAVQPVARMRVKKFGRTTGLTLGSVEGVADEPTPLPYLAKCFKGTVWFCPVWYVRSDSGPFALPGDSGSLVVTADGASAVGMLFAADRGGSIGLMTPLAPVLALFGGLALVSGHGVS